LQPGSQLFRYLVESAFGSHNDLNIRPQNKNAGRLTFIGESARSRMSARYSVVVRKMNRTENSRKRWYLAAVRRWLWLWGTRDAKLTCASRSTLCRSST
jgi:hypothetical protein